MNASYLTLFNTFRVLGVTVKPNFFTTQCRAKLFSSKPPVQHLISLSETGEEVLKKTKRQPVPKITLLSGDNVSVTTLDEAKKLSKRRDLKLVKIIDVDTKSNRPVYKLMTGTEYHAEDLKQRELKKQKKEKVAIKGEKVLMLNSSISPHDLQVKANQIGKWLQKKYEVKLVISGDLEQAENACKFFEDHLKEARFLQKRTKGTDLKCQIIPPKKDDSDKPPL